MLAARPLVVYNHTADGGRLGKVVTRMGGKIVPAGSKFLSAARQATAVLRGRNSLSRSDYHRAAELLMEITMLKCRATFSVILILVATRGLRVEAQDVSPMALLRGVEASRIQHTAVKAAIEIRYLSSRPPRTIECLVEQDGAKRRLEILGGNVDQQVIFRDGETFHSFRRVEHADVELYGVDDAVGTRGDLAFDPRILGLSDLMSCNTTVDVCLWYEGTDALEVVGRDTISGHNVWHVKATRNGNTSEYWIEEPSFRVHRRTTNTKATPIQINSEFGASAVDTPYPMRVSIRRSDSSGGFEREYIVHEFDAAAEIPAERFTLAAMDLPINTAVVDYRISRRIGFWDGEGLSEDPVYRGERPALAPAPPVSWPNRLLRIAGSLLVIAALVVVWWWRKRGASTMP
jgi:hypothetical protein